MNTHTRLLVVIAAIATASDITEAQSMPSSAFTRDAVLAAMRKVNAHRLTQEPARKWDAKPTAQGDNWVGGTYYTGVMALYRATGDKTLLDQAAAWAQRGKWAPGTEAETINNLTCCQTYLELHAVEKDEARIAKTRDYVDRLVKGAAGKKTVAWGYCDTLYVGPPAIAMLGEITGDKKYCEYLDKAYWGTTDDLLDKEEGLFYRDRRYIGQKTEKGRKVLWGRGNGWVIGGIPRILEHLPKDWPTRPRYVELLKTMSAALAKAQQPDGLWRTNLADPDDFPHPDTSGAAFYCYAMAWGMNQGHLDKQTYLPVVAKAWLGMLNCIAPNGRLGYAQRVGDRPGVVGADWSQLFTDGPFLLSGSELLKLAGDLAAIQVTVEPVRPGPAPQSKPKPAPATKPAPLAMPAGAASIEAETPKLLAMTPANDSLVLGPSPEGYAYDKGDIKLSDTFKRVAAPGTGRKAVQLTTGKGDNTPLYYFIPSLTRDLRYLVYHSTSTGTIQACRLDLHTGESVQLTRGDTRQKGWWGSPGGVGVLDHRTALNVARSQVIYITGPDGREVRMVDLATLKDTLLFELPEGHEALAQNACTPDGKWFLYNHAPVPPAGLKQGQKIPGQTCVVAYNVDTREQKVLHKGENRYHHVMPYGNDRAFFCHPWSLVGFDGQPAVPTPTGCHSMVTARGIVSDGSSLYHPLTGKRVSVGGGKGWAYYHTGWDPEGQFWFWEVKGGGHRLVYLKRYDETGKGQHEFADLTGEWRNSAGGQRGHFHPQLLPDRKWVLISADEVDAGPKPVGSHMFLIDVSDLGGADLVGDAVRKNPKLIVSETQKRK